MLRPNKIIKGLAFIFSVIILSTSLSYAVFAVWQEPAQTPPNCTPGDPGCDAPVNIGPLVQVKSGGLILATDSTVANGLGVLNGNVGIGTLTPGAKLDVIGNSAATGIGTLSTGGYSTTVTIAGGNFNDVESGSQLIVNTGGATPYNNIRTVVSKTDSTHVVIDQKVNWSAETFTYIKYPQGVKTTGVLTTTGTVSFLGDYEGEGGIYIPKMDMLVGGGSDAVFKFRHEDIAGKANLIIFGNNKEEVPATTNTMTIDTENANVGIGTLNPRAKFDVMGGVGPWAATKQMVTLRGDITSVDNTHAAQLELNTTGAIGSISRLVFSRIGDTSASIQSAGNAAISGWLSLSTRKAGGNLLERMRIDEDGNVGIGTGAPTDSLHIKMTASEIALESTGAGVTDYSHIHFLNTGGQSYGLGAFSPNVADVTRREKFFISDNTGGNILLAIDGKAASPTFGNVGIGTTTAGQKLEVNGGVKLNTAAARPACGATTRGTFWFTQGAAGVKDSVAVCAKDALNAYAWRTLY